MHVYQFKIKVVNESRLTTYYANAVVTINLFVNLLGLKIDYRSDVVSP